MIKSASTKQIGSGSAFRSGLGQNRLEKLSSIIGLTVASPVKPNDGRLVPPPASSQETLTVPHAPHPPQGRLRLRRKLILRRPYNRKPGITECQIPHMGQHCT